ncbi:MAG: transposase [Thermoanaerobaculia bacterium]
MKDQAIQYLAFDVHQATCEVSLRDASGSVVMRGAVPTEATAVLRVVKGAGPRVHVAFEEGTQAQWLHDLIVPHAERVVVCNLRGERKSGNKNDRVDVDELSKRLRGGNLRGVFHGTPSVLNLKELVRSYNNPVEDATRVMQRIKALFRARGIKSVGQSVYRPADRKEWLGKLTGGSRVRAEVLLKHLDVLLELRPPAKAAMLAEAKKQAGWKILRSIPYLGPIRVAEILAIMRTPHRFRTKRNLWPYAGLAVVTFSSADKEIVDGQVRKRKRAPMTRGLNRNHNPILKEVFKGATAATVRPGPLRDFYESSLKRGVREELAK